MNLNHPKVLSKINTKKALMFVIYRKLIDKKIIGKIKKFTGYQNIGMIKIENLQNLHIKLEVHEGQFVLVAIQKRQLKILAENQMDSPVTLPFSKGWARLRLIGDHTSLNFEIKKN